jgi:hypothetical protein
VKRREAYRSPDSLPGTTTWRDEGSAKGLPPDHGDGGGATDPDSASRRERALPAPGGSSAEETPPSQPVHNVPGPSDSHPDGSLHKDRARTKSVPGDQYDPEPISQPGGGFRRRTLQGVEAGKKKPFPSTRQKKQKGRAYLNSRRWYKKNRKKKIMQVKRKYRVEKNKGWKKRDIKNRNNPSKDKRFQRKPGGGYSKPAERSKDWRGGDKRTKLEVKRKNAAFDESILHRTPPEASTVGVELELMLELQSEVRSDFMDFILWLEDAGPTEMFLAELDDLGLELPLDEVFEIADGAAAVAAVLKAEFARPRPADTALELGIPLDAVGEHPSWSYPSTHVLQAELVSRYLSHIYPEHEDLFRDLSDDVTRSRVIGGMHFPSDCEYAADLADEMEEDMIQEWGYSDDGAGRVARRADFFRDQEWNPQRSDDSRETSAVPRGDDAPSQEHDGLTTWIGPQDERENETPAQGSPPDRDRPGAPGSARVIPRGQGFVGRTANRQIVATKLAEIMGGTAQVVQQRANELSVKMTRVIGKSPMWLFNVSGGDDTHRVRLKAVRKGNVRTLAKADLLVSCDCNFWRWQGPEHWAKAGGYLYGRPLGSASSPAVRDPNGEHRVCKHVVAVLRKAEGYRFRTKNQDTKARERRRNKTASPWDALIAIWIPSPGRVVDRHERWRDA